MVPATFAAAFARRRDGSRRSVDDCFRLLYDAGYRYADYTPDYSGDWRKEVDEALRASEKYGIRMIQSHAPFNFYAHEPMDVFRKKQMDSAEAAKLLGVQNLVFHFDEYHPDDEHPFDPEVAVSTIYEIVAPAVSRTAESGVHVALETIFEDNREKRTHFCGTFDEVVRAIDVFHDDRVGCCWDFGHAQMAYGKDHAENIRKMGSRIFCTHVHDNYFGTDLHLLPYTGNHDWESLIPALRDTGYDGALAYEQVYGCMPDRLLPDWLALSYRVMDSLCGIEKGPLF